MRNYQNWNNLSTTDVNLLTVRLTMENKLI